MAARQQPADSSDRQWLGEVDWAVLRYDNRATKRSDMVEG